MEQRVTPFLVALLLGLSAPGGASPAAPGAVPVAPRDTLLRVSRGDRLTLRNFAGSLEVEGWERDELLLETDPSDLPAVRGWREGSAVIVGVQDPKGRRLARSLRVSGNGRSGGNGRPCGVSRPRSPCARWRGTCR